MIADPDAGHDDGAHANEAVAVNISVRVEMTRGDHAPERSLLALEIDFDAPTRHTPRPRTRKPGFTARALAWRRNSPSSDTP